MEDVIIPIIVVPVIFLGLPWIIFHYITRWKSQATLTREDENLMDELYDLARRLDDRMCSIERIMSAENPNWRQVGCDPVDGVLENHADAGLESLGSTAARSRSTAGRTRG